MAKTENTEHPRADGDNHLLRHEWIERWEAIANDSTSSPWMRRFANKRL